MTLLVDFVPELKNMARHRLRMTIAPAGVFRPIHDDKDRPGIVYILQGTITDDRNELAANSGPGGGWPEDREYYALA